MYRDEEIISRSRQSDSKTGGLSQLLSFFETRIPVFTPGVKPTMFSTIHHRLQAEYPPPPGKPLLAMEEPDTNTNR
jgi:hypothetical protein